MIDVRIQAGEFDPGRQLRRFEELGRAAIASFVAIAEASGEEVTEILIEHHAALAKSELGRIAAEADRRWPIAGIILIHRHGRLAPGSRIAMAAVAAGHRDALEACAFLAEALRTRAPFWRKEIKADGTGHWVEPG